MTSPLCIRVIVPRFSVASKFQQSNLQQLFADAFPSTSCSLFFQCERPSGMPTAKWDYVPHQAVGELWFPRDSLFFGSVESKTVAATSSSSCWRLQRFELSDDIAPAAIGLLSPLEAVYAVLMNADMPLSAERVLELIRQRTKLASEDLAALGYTIAAIEDKLKYELRRKAMRSPFRDLCNGHYYLAVRETEVLGCVSISAEYRNLGMRLFHQLRAFWIPADVEHRFLECRPSTIGPGVGLGLFVRRNRSIRQGTILAEYCGSVSKIPPSTKQEVILPYTIKTKTGVYITGIDNDGYVTCLAAVANDGGVENNAELTEFTCAKDRVFVVAQREIGPGTEVTVSYGQSYWGQTRPRKKSRSEDRPAKKNSRLPTEPSTPAAAPATQPAEPISPKGTVLGEENPMLDPSENIERVGAPVRCRDCRTVMSRRFTKLHMAACKDALTTAKLDVEDCLPFNEFTCVVNPRHRKQKKKVITLDDRRKAAVLVDGDPLHAAMSHEDLTDDDGDSSGSEVVKIGRDRVGVKRSRR